LASIGAGLTDLDLFGLALVVLFCLGVNFLLFFIALVNTSFFTPVQLTSDSGILRVVTRLKVFEILALDRGSFLGLVGGVSLNDSVTNFFLTIFHVELLHSQCPDFLKLFDLLEVGSVVRALCGIEASPETFSWIVRVTDRIV